MGFGPLSLFQKVFGRSPQLNTLNTHPIGERKRLDNSLCRARQRVERAEWNSFGSRGQAGVRES